MKGKLALQFWVLLIGVAFCWASPSSANFWKAQHRWDDAAEHVDGKAVSYRDKCYQFMSEDVAEDFFSMDTPWYGNAQCTLVPYAAYLACAYKYQLPFEILKGSQRITNETNDFDCNTGPGTHRRILGLPNDGACPMGKVLSPDRRFKKLFEYLRFDSVISMESLIQDTYPVKCVDRESIKGGTLALFRKKSDKGEFEGHALITTRVDYDGKVHFIAGSLPAKLSSNPRDRFQNGFDTFAINRTDTYKNYPDQERGKRNDRLADGWRTFWPEPVNPGCVSPFDDRFYSDSDDEIEKTSYHMKAIEGQLKLGNKTPELKVEDAAMAVCKLVKGDTQDDQLEELRNPIESQMMVETQQLKRGRLALVKLALGSRNHGRIPPGSNEYEGLSTPKLDFQIKSAMIDLEDLMCKLKYGNPDDKFIEVVDTPYGPSIKCLGVTPVRGAAVYEAARNRIFDNCSIPLKRDGQEFRLDLNKFELALLWDGDPRDPRACHRVSSDPNDDLEARWGIAYTSDSAGRLRTVIRSCTAVSTNISENYGASTTGK